MEVINEEKSCEKPPPDFSKLPDTVWVKVMQMLSLNDRFYVSVMCSRLNEVFNHPSVWHTVIIKLLGDESRHITENNEDRVSMAECYIKMIERFGGYFQNLTLMFIGYFSGMSKPCRHVLEQLSERCRLERLTLHVGIIRTKIDYYAMRERVGKYMGDDLEALAMFVANAHRLNAFILKSWPCLNNPSTSQEHRTNILKVLTSNRQIHNLEHMCLFYEHDSNWMTLNPVLPKPSEIREMLKAFQNIKFLSLRLCMIDEGVLDELAVPLRQSKLKKLQILVTWSRHREDLAVPDIPSSTWRKLTKACPNLNVEFTFMTRMPWMEKSAVLKPDIPVTSLQFNEYSNLGASDIQTITSRYSECLQKFTSYTKDTDDCMGDVLACLSKMCPQINTFVYHGKISQNTILALVTSHPNTWKQFEVQESEIIFDNEDGDDDDTVIGRRDDGQLYLTAINRKPCEDPRHEGSLIKLFERVSEILGRKWYAVPHQNESLSE